MQALERFVQMVNDTENIVFFGGAGVSTESGLPDFRSEDGLYRQTYAYLPETMLSHDFFMAHTEEFFAFYRDKMLYPDAEPNTTHRTLAALERAGKLKAIVTQNIDGLHQAAGSRTVYELHGSVQRNTCMRCKRRYDLPFIQHSTGVPRCACGGVVKPDVVLYGEGLDSATVEGAVAATRARSSSSSTVRQRPPTRGQTSACTSPLAKRSPRWASAERPGAGRH